MSGSISKQAPAGDFCGSSLLHRLFVILFILLQIEHSQGSSTSCDDYSHVTSHIGQQYAHQITRAYHDGSVHENKVIDKNVYTCTRTKCHSDIAPWWRLDMGSVVNISKVTIYAALDDVDSLMGIDVLLSLTSPPVRRTDGVNTIDFSGYTLCNTIDKPVIEGMGSYIVKCKKPTVGRYIAVRRNLDPTKKCTYLHMCEVDIWKADQLTVTISPSTLTLDEGRVTSFTCNTEPIECKNFYYFWSFGSGFFPFNNKMIRFGLTKKMAPLSLHCYVKNTQNIELGHAFLPLRKLRYAPKFNKTNPDCHWKNREVAEGEPVMLHCHVGEANPPVALDYKYNQRAFPSIDVKVSTKTYKAFGEGKRVKSVLTIKMARRQMNGEKIILKIMHPLIKTKRYALKPLVVKFAPDKTNTTLTADVSTDSSTFSCYAEAALPKPKIKWMILNRQNISVNDEMKVNDLTTPVKYTKAQLGFSAHTALTISDYGLRMNGYQIQCVIEHEVLKSPIVMSHILRVKKAPDTSLIALSVSPKTYGESDQLYITCDVPECYPPPEITWIAPDTMLQLSKTKENLRVVLKHGIYYRSELRVSKVLRDWNRQNVSCEVNQNLLERSYRTDPHHVNVEFSPETERVQLVGNSILEDGMTAKFACNVPEANPVASTKWILHNIHSQPAGRIEEIGKETSKTVLGENGGYSLKSTFTMKVSKAYNGYTLICVVSQARLPQDIKKHIVLRIKYAPDTSEIDLKSEPNELVGGKSAKFTCIAPAAIPLPTLKWNFSSPHLVNPDTLPAQKLRYVKTKRYVTLEFEVPSLTRQWNKKSVHCLVSHELLSRKEVKRTLKLDVLFPPKTQEIEFPEPPRIEEGQNVSFVCKSPEANPAATIKWSFKTKDGTAVQLLEWSAREGFKIVDGKFGGKTTVATLNIPKVVREWDESIISCHISHQLFKKQEIRNHSVDVRYGFELNDVKLIATPSAHKENQNGTFICKIPFASPPPNVTWILPPSLQKLRRSEKHIKVNKMNEYYLTLGPLTRKHNDEVVKCLVSLDSWSRSRVWNATVKVKFPPIRKIPIFSGSRFVTVGSKVNFTCASDEASPEMNITWILQNRLNESVKLPRQARITVKKTSGENGGIVSVSRLSFESVEKRMNGYKLFCQLSHAMLDGSYSEMAAIRVKFGPNAESFTLQQNPTYTQPDLPVHFICDVPEASPKPNVTWTYPEEMKPIATQKEVVRVGPELGIIVKSTLSLKQVKHTWSKANISCIAKFNTSSPMIKKISLNMKFPPIGRSVVINGPNSMTEGTMGVFRCSATEALPRATISWRMTDTNKSPVSLEEISTQSSVITKGKYGGFITEGILNITAKPYMNKYVLQCVVDHELRATVTSRKSKLTIYFGPRSEGIRLTQRPRLVSAKENASFVCDVPEASPRAGVEWTIPIDIRAFADTETQAHRGKRNGEAVTSILTLINMQPQWNGKKVTCTATYQNFGSTERSVPIRMKFPPMFNAPNLTSPKGVLRPGEHASFVCLSTESSPAANISWTLSDLQFRKVPLPRNTQKSSSVAPGKHGGFISISNLTIYNIHAEMSGFTISCETRHNQLDNPQTTNATIFLQHGPDARLFRLEQVPRYANPGSPLKLICNIPDSTPLPDVRWSYPDQVMPFVKTETKKKLGSRYGEALVSTLTLTSTKHSWNRFLFRCEINHTLVGEKERSIRLHLRDATTFVGMENSPAIGVVPEEGSFISRCTVKACHPQCSVLWLAKFPNKTKKIMKSELLRPEVWGGTVSELHLKMKEEFDGAKIVCTLNDTDASLESPALRISGAPKVQLKVLTNNIIENGNARFMCTSSINNPPINQCEFGRSNHVITWRRGPGSFQLQRITRQEGGWYWCRCENILGSNTHKAFLTVRIASRKLKVSQSTVEVIENSTISITCENDAAFPPAEMVWESLNKTAMRFETISNPLDTTFKAYKTVSRVHLKVNRYDNGAILNCVAYNPSDSSMLAKSVRIHVFYPPDVRIVPSREYPPEGTRNFSLECVSQRGNPDNFFYKWMTSSYGLLLENKTTLSLPRLLRNSTGTRYKCVVMPSQRHVPRNELQKLVVEKEYEVKVSYMDVSIDKIVRILNEKAEANMVLNITASPLPTEFLWLSGGKVMRLKSNVLSTRRDFIQVEVKFEPSVINKTRPGQHTLSINHKSGTRNFIVEVEKIGNAILKTNDGFGGQEFPWKIILIAVGAILFLLSTIFAILMLRKKTRFRKKLVISGKGNHYPESGGPDAFANPKGKPDPGVPRTILTTADNLHTCVYTTERCL